jgi:hypothetical protein
MLDSETKVTQAKTRAIEARTESMREIIITSHTEMLAFKPEIAEKTIACQEMEAHLEEENQFSRHLPTS